MNLPDLSAAAPLIAPQNTGPSLDTSSRNLQTRVLPLTVGVPVTLTAPGDFLFIQSNAGGANFEVRTDTGTVFTIPGRRQSGYRFARPFNVLTLTANSFENLGTTGTLILQIGFGAISEETPSYFKRSISLQTRPNNVTPYGVGDVVAGGAPFVFQPVLRPTMDGTAAIGEIIGAKLMFDSSVTANGNFTLFLFSIAPAVVDNAAFAPSLVDWQFCQAIINFPSLITGAAGTGTVCSVGGISMPFEASSTLTTGVGVQSLTGVLMANAAYVPIALGNIGLEIFTTPPRG